MHTEDINDRGFGPIEYRVMMPDLRVVCTTKDIKKAERISKQTGGSIHASKETGNVK